MIKLNNSEKYTYTLVLASENDLKNDVIKNSKQTVVINQNEGKFYLKVDFKRVNQRLELIKKLTEFGKDNRFNLNVDLDSFINNLQLEKETIFNTVVETLGIAGHQQVLMKKPQADEPNPQAVSYNLQTTFSELESLFAKELLKVEYTNYARDLQDTPPNLATSEFLADKISKDAKNIPNVKVQVFGLKEIQKMQMGLLLAVNAASEIEPRVVVVEYQSDPSLPKTALVGKGITFDSGGYNLKPSKHLKAMKFDMSGAAIMISTVFALAKAGVKANVAAIGMFTDNRIGGHGNLPESIITSMNGLTVQIDDTDAEGRMVLADGLTYAVRELKADRIIDAATLTGSIVYALGEWNSGAFTYSDELWTELSQASTISGEDVWRMPLRQDHLDIMQETPIADLTNAESGMRGAFSSTAAAFLNEFVEEKPFLHLDIAGTADDGQRGTGVMVRTLFELLNK